MGGFEPFGADYSGASDAGVFLRFPGQWDDVAWEEPSVGAEVVYNVHRWYQSSTGTYTKTDPLGLSGDPHPYSFGFSNPITLFDPLGLYTLDNTCKCPNTDPPGSLGTGLPEGRLRVEVDTICSQLEQQITDPKLRRCIKKSCDRGRITCRQMCGLNEKGEPIIGLNDRRFLGSIQLKNRKANLCLDNIPFDVRPGALGDVVVHEWAHGCKWEHVNERNPDGKGVPGPTGEIVLE